MWPFDDEAFLTEIKYDGYRVLEEFEHGRTELKTRGGAEGPKWFPETVKALAGLERGRNIVHGEVCVLDELGRSSGPSRGSSSSGQARYIQGALLGSRQNLYGRRRPTTLRPSFPCRLIARAIYKEGATCTNAFAVDWTA